MLSTPLLVEALNAHAKALGFDLFGIAPAHDSDYAAYFREWIAAGRHGQMDYLAKRLAERVSPQTYFPGCRSVLCVAINYHVPAVPPAATAASDDQAAVPGRIARYAWGEDYHEPIKEKLHRLADRLRELAPHAETRCAVDTAPVAERELAARAGLGWIGKNTCLIHPRMGSWLLLGVVLTTLELPPSKSLPPQGHCGTCTRCLDACPTDALHPDRPYQLDASQCIAYLTIEHRGDIPPPLAEAVGDWLFGCDICQDVCPFNRKAPAADLAANPFLTPRIPGGTVDARAVAGWSLEQWHGFSRRTAMRRLGLPLFQRNATIVVRNHDARRQAGHVVTEANAPTPPPPAPAVPE